MAIPSISPAGATREEQQLWNTYLFWARSAADPTTKKQKTLKISKRVNRIKDSTARNLQIILFSAFALEYRLRNTYGALGLQVRKKDSLNALIQNFSHRIRTATRVDGQGLVKLSSEWASIEKRLLRLSKWRNKIAHADSLEVLALISSDARKSRREARSCFNAVIDTIRVTNRAIGYDLDSPRADRNYYASLRLKL